MANLSYESRCSQAVLRLAYGCYLNALWLICSIPVLTIGASTTALYAVSLKIADNEEGNITAQFFHAFRRDFRQATTLWLVLLAAGLVLGTDIYVLLHLRAASTGAPAILFTIALALVIVACLVLGMVLMYVFPLVARVENTNLAMIRNSLLIGTRYLFCTICVFAIHAVMAIAVIAIFTPLIVLGEGVCAVLSSYLLSPVIRACTRQPDPASDDVLPTDPQRHDP